MSDPATLAEEFVSLLEARRPYWNALARRTKGLDTAAFSAHLCGPVHAVVMATAPADRGRVLDVVYALSLRALRKRLLGRGPSASGGLQRFFESSLPLLVPHIAPEIGHIAPALANAVLLVEQRTGDAGPWLANLEGWAKEADPGDPEARITGSALLDVGLVLAWRMGVAELREAAIDRYASLAPSVQDGLFPTRAIAAAPSDRFRAPGEAGLAEPRVLYRVGGHIALGGSFVEPPLVATHGGTLYAYDSQRTMRVFADAFGAGLRRAHVDPTAPEEPLPEGVSLRAGELSWPNVQPVELPLLRKTSSAAYSDGALAVTLPQSHHVFIVGRPAGAS